MRKTFFRLTVALLLLLTVLPLSFAAAQETEPLTNVFDVGDGYVISAPDGWQIEQDEETGGFLVSNEEVTLFVLNPVQVSDRIDIEADAELDDLLIDLYDDLYDERARRRDIELIELGGREAASWAYEDGRFEGVFYVIRLSNDTIGAVDAYSRDVDIADVSDLLTAMVTSFDAGEGGQAVAPVAAVEPCFVSTEDAETVQLRVGPGSNRTVVAFLPADEEFEVAGRFTDDDGNVWYQLNKEEVLPNSAANEIWVSADAVDETGDCDAVVDASAPPIVPITNPPSTTGGGGTTGGTTGGGTTGGVIPSAGRWTMSLDGTSTASCAGTNTITFPTSDLFARSSLAFSMTSVASDGSTFVFGGETFTRQPNGYYNGSISLPDGSNVQVYLFPSSSTFMSGTIVYNLTLNGVGCSSTTVVSASR